MNTLREEIDQHLANLAWSLWTELGVAGVKREHHQFLIMPEELILLTAAIGESDPRLRDEALDWCSRYHHYISISRLRTLASLFDPSLLEPLSVFSATLNSISAAKWPVFTSASPLKLVPSGKSKSPRFESPSLLCFRLRELFGVGARADLILFCLGHENNDFSVADATEIGYGKRYLADVLEGFVHAEIVDVFTIRNQQRYCFVKRDPMIELLAPLPEFMLPWHQIFEVVLLLRARIRQFENQSISTRVIEIRNTLMKIDDKLRRLNLSPPSLQSDLLAYWDSFGNWMLNLCQSLARAKFKGKTMIAKSLPLDANQSAAKRMDVQFKGLFTNVESLKTHVSEQVKNSLFENYKKSFRKTIDLYLSQLSIEDQKKLRALADKVLSKDKNEFTESLRSEIFTEVDQILAKYLNNHR